MLPRARELVHHFAETEELMLNKGQSSTLKLGSTITVGTCLTPFLIPELQKSCPEVTISSYVNNTREIEHKLLRSELDAGIVEGEIKSSDLKVIPIVDDCLVLAVGKLHPLYLKKWLSVQELDHQQFAMREPGSGTRQLFEEYASRHQISFQTTWEANSPRTLLNAVLYDKVLSVMSVRLMYHEIKHGSIHIFQNEKGEWNRKFKLVYHKNKYLTPAIYELEKLLREYQNIEMPESAGILR